ncbi:MAG: TetR/AcrR family transcriptional regulator [Planctomycetes bacterium]|nr:TetR/AcrR family transcriptional regulator [Planctomycetota bacterium]
MKSDHAAEADTRSAVLRQAAALFADNGYDAVSVREIVGAAGVTKPALYYHFGNKEGVARALIDEFLNAATVMRQGVFAEADGVRELIETYTREMLALAVDFKDTLAFAFSLWFGRSSLKNLIRHTEEYDACVTAEWKQQLVARGMSARQGELAIKTYWALLMHELLKTVQCPEFKGCADSLANEMATLVLNGVSGFEGTDV